MKYKFTIIAAIAAVFSAPAKACTLEQLNERMPQFLAHNIKAGQGFKQLLDDAVALRTDCAKRMGEINPDEYGLKSTSYIPLAECEKIFDNLKSDKRDEGYTVQKYNCIIDFIKKIKTLDLFSEKNIYLLDWFFRASCLFLKLDILKINYQEVASEFYLKNSIPILIEQQAFDRYKQGPKFNQVCLAISNRLFHKTLNDISVHRLKLLERSMSLFKDPLCQKINIIPHITHRCWITNENKPYEVPEEMLNYYIQSIKTFKESGSWTHYFWCLDPAKIPQTIHYLMQANVGITVKSVFEIFKHMKAKHIFDAYLADNRFSGAADVLKINLVNIYGGLYSDIGVEFNHDLTHFFDCYDYLIFLVNNSNVDITTIAACANSFLLSEFLNKIDKLYLLPKDIKSITPSPSMHNIWTGSYFIMSCMDCLLSGGEKISYFIDGRHISLHRMNTWNNDPKFGNKNVYTSSLDIFCLKPSNNLLPEYISQSEKNELETLYKQYFLKDTTKDVWQDFFSQLSGITEQKYDEDIIVSLTSYPERMSTTWLTIESLMRQSFKPNRIVLNLSKEEYPDRIVPWMLQSFLRRGLEINWCDGNEKAYKKVIPTILKYPTSCVISADDDIIYPTDWLFYLYEAHLQHPDCVISRDVKSIKSKNGIVAPISHWEFTYFSTTSQMGPSLTLAPEGGHGVFYPPNSFFDKGFNPEYYQKLCATEDDLWMYVSVINNGKKVFRPEKKGGQIIFIQKAQESSKTLVKINQADDGRISNNCINNLTKAGFLNVAGYRDFSSNIYLFLEKTLTTVPKSISVSLSKMDDFILSVVLFKDSFTQVLKDGVFLRGPSGIFEVFTKKFQTPRFSIKMSGMPTITQAQSSIDYYIMKGEKFVNRGIINRDHPYIELEDIINEDVQSYSFLTKATQQNPYWITFCINKIEFN